MPLQAKVGSLTWLAADPVGTTYTVSGLAFQPKFVFLWTSGRGESVDTAGTANHRRGAGFFKDTTNRRAVCDFSQAAAANAVTARAHSDVACFITVSTDGTAIDGGLDVDAILSDGFRLIVDDAAPADLRIHYWALGGMTLSLVEIGSLQEPGATGDQDVTVTGFTAGAPDQALLFIAAPNAGTPPDPDSRGRFMLGAVAGNPIANAVLSVSSANGVTNMDTNSYCRAGECLAKVDWAVPPANVSARASVTAWLANGFRLNWAELSSPANAAFYFYAALKGGQYAVGDFLTQTNTTQFSEAVPFKPVAALFVSHCKAQSAADTAQVHDETSIGAATGPAERAAHGVIDEDGVGTSDVGTAVEHDEIYANLSLATAVEGLCDLVNFTEPGMDLVMDDADPAAAFVFYLAIGDAALLPRRPRRYADEQRPRRAVYAA